jgi:hypothetical protein
MVLAFDKTPHFAWECVNTCCEYWQTFHRYIPWYLFPISMTVRQRLGVIVKISRITHLPEKMQTYNGDFICC